MTTNNTVSLKLAIEGGQVVSAEIDGVKTKLDGIGVTADKAGQQLGGMSAKMSAMAASFTVGNLAAKGFEFAMSKVGDALGYVLESAQMAARFETLGVVMQTVGRNAGYTGQQMMDASKGVQALGITMLEARESVTKMASAHIDLANAQGLARVAQDAAVIGGVNSSEAFKAMIYGIQSGQTEVLRTIGINVSFEASYKTLAAQLGTTAQALTEAEKTTARTNVVMAAGKDIAGAYEDAMGTAGKQMTSLARYSEDAKVKLGAVFNDTLLLAIGVYTGHLKESNAELDKLTKDKSIEDWSQRMAVWFAFAGDAAKNSFNVIATGADTIYTALKQLNAIASLRGGDAIDAGNDWVDRIKARFDPQGQLRVVLQKMQAQKELDARTLTETVAGNNPSAMIKVQTVFDSPQAKQARQDELAALAKYGRDRANAIETANTATAAIMNKGRTTEQKILDEQRKYRKELTDAGLATDSVEAQRALKQIEINGRKGKATGDAAKQDVYAAEAARLYASTMNGLAKAQESASAKADGLSKAQEALRVVQASPHWAQYSRQMQEQIIYAASLTQAEEDREVTTKDNAKAQAELTKAMDAYAAAQQKAVVAGFDEVEKAQAAYDAHGKLASALQEELLARLELDRRAMTMGTSDTTELAAIDAQIESKKKLISILQKGELRDASEKGAKDAADAWAKTADSINSTLTDALMRGFESGKSFAVNMRDTIVNMFKTMVLRPVISAVMNPIAQGLTGAMGFTNVASAANGVGNAGTALSGISALAGNFGAGIAEGFATAWGAGGSLSGALSMGTGMMEAGSLSGGFGAVVGALGPIAVGIGALVAISKMTAGEMRSGGQYSYNAITGVRYSQGPSGGEINAPEVTKAISGTVETINKLLAGGVGSASQLIGFQAGLETSGDNRGGVLAGGTLTGGATFGQSGGGSNYDGTKFDPSKSFNMDAQAAATAFSLELQQSVIEALQAATDIPTTIAGMVNGVVANTLSAADTATLLQNIDAVVTGVNSFNAAAKTLPFENLKNLSFDAAAGLIAAAGGMQTLGSNLNTYYSAFYSAEEQRAQTIKNINATVGGAGISGFDAATATREAFRALVEGQDLTATSGQQAYAALLSVAGAFDQINPAAQSASGAVTQVVKSLAKSLDDIASERKNLQNQLDTLTLTSVQLLEQQRNAIDASNQGLFDQVQAAQAAKDAAAALAQAQEDAAAALVTLTKVNQGWQDQLDVLTGKQTDHSIALRDATDASTRALMEQVWAQQEFTVRQKAAAAERLGLEYQLLGLQGNTAAIRALDLAKLDASNQALQQNIWALQDQKTAADAATTAAATLKSAWQSISDSLMAEVKRIRGLLDQGAGSSLAGLQSAFAITTAQARAGDQDAAKSLTGLSQSLLTAIEANAASLADLQLARAQVAASLEGTATMGMDGAAAHPTGGASGLPSITVPYQPHPALLTQPVTDNLRTAVADGNAALEDKVQALNDKIAQLQIVLETMTIAANKQARIQDKWDIDGMPAVRA